MDDDLLVEKVDINQTEITTTEIGTDIGSGNYSSEDVANFQSATPVSEKVEDFHF